MSSGVLSYNEFKLEAGLGGDLCLLCCVVFGTYIVDGRGMFVYHSMIGVVVVVRILIFFFVFSDVIVSRRKIKIG